MVRFINAIHRTLPAALAVSLLALACGGGGSSGGGSGSGSGSGSSSGGAPADNCPSLAGTYDVTSEIVSTDCPVGLHVITEPITWTFVQTAPSCSFKMTNSLYPTSQYAGTFTMEGTQAKVTWTSVSPAPVSAGHALTYTSESLTVTGTATLSGSFAWSSAYGCTGTTNICHGSVSAGCANPT
jgi:hypothetical protein